MASCAPTKFGVCWHLCLWGLVQKWPGSENGSKWISQSTCLGWDVHFCWKKEKYARCFYTSEGSWSRAVVKAVLPPEVWKGEVTKWMSYGGATSSERLWKRTLQLITRYSLTLVLRKGNFLNLEESRFYRWYSSSVRGAVWTGSGPQEPRARCLGGGGGVGTSLTEPAAVPTCCWPAVAFRKTLEGILVTAPGSCQN